MDIGYQPNLQRWSALDTARGLAVLGILLVNMFSFALPEMVRATPLLLVDASGLDLLLWYAIHIFADTKFITLLTLVFGASLWLFAEHKKNTDPERLDALQLRRSLWLAGFGVAHSYLVWDGDVLFTYAICALIVWHWRHWSDTRLLGTAAAIFVLGSLLMWLLMVALSAGLFGELMVYPTAEEMAEEIAHYQQGWWAQMPERILRSLDLQFSIILTGWTSLALMLVGVVLVRRGFLSLQVSLAAYRILIALTLIPGLILIAAGLWISIEKNFAADFIFVAGYQLHFLGSSLVGVAYLALVMYWCRSASWQWLQRILAAVGRMALSIYIMQSLICTWLFYGFGLGLYGQLSLTQLLLVALSIWLFQCLFACWWLRHYQFGPLEWLWRRLVYRQSQLFKR